jgi:hypothetical protein
MALTEYHALFLYSERLTAVSLLNQSIVYDDYFGKVNIFIRSVYVLIIFHFQKYGKIGGMMRDPVSGFVWVFSEGSVFKYRPVDETR